MGALALTVLLLAGLGLRGWYASWGLNQKRFWDERYALRNVHSILSQHTFAPASSYYPSPVFNLPPALMLAASNKLSELTGEDHLLAWRGHETRPAGYFLCRLLQAVAGTFGLLLTFLVGRSLFGPAVGFSGALILTFLPWHVHASGYFKPDALLTTSVLLAFFLSLEAVRKPTAARYGLAGLAIALALSSKLTGGIIAIPLAVASLALARRERRRIWLLLLAASVSLLAFIALNPYWANYLHWLSGLQRDYAMRAGWTEMTRLSVLGRALALIPGRYGHGALLGGLAYGAWVLLTTASARGRLDGYRRAGVVMFVLFPPLYILAYSLATPYFKSNNLLPVFPFTSLLAAWLVHQGWRRIPEGWRRRGFSGLAALTLVAWVAPPGVLYVYRSLTPTTRDAAITFLRQRLKPPEGRTVIVEEWTDPEPRWEGSQPSSRGRIAMRESERLDELSRQELRLADGQVFLAERMTGDRGTWYRDWLDLRRHRQHRTFRPRLFQLRGPPLVAIRHPWRSIGDPVAVPLAATPHQPGCFTAPLPQKAPEAEAVSFTLLIRSPVPSASPRARLDLDRDLELVWIRRGRDGDLYGSERRRDARSLRVCLEGGDRAGDAPITALAHRWQRRGRGPDKANRISGPRGRSGLEGEHTNTE